MHRDLPRIVRVREPRGRGPQLGAWGPFMVHDARSTVMSIGSRAGSWTVESEWPRHKRTKPSKDAGFRSEALKRLRVQTAHAWDEAVSAGALGWVTHYWGPAWMTQEGWSRGLTAQPKDGSPFIPWAAVGGVSDLREPATLYLLWGQNTSSSDSSGMGPSRSKTRKPWQLTCQPTQLANRDLCSPDGDHLLSLGASRVIFASLLPFSHFLMSLNRKPLVEIFFSHITFFFKSLLNLLQYCFCCFMFCFFGQEACGILAT